MTADRVIGLTKQAISFFEQMNNIRYDQNTRKNKPENMHFVANILLDLVEITYPIQANDQDDFKAYKSFVNFLREDNCPRIRIPTYRQWQQ